MKTNKEIKERLWKLANKEGTPSESFMVDINGNHINVEKITIDRPQGIFTFEYYINNVLVSRGGDRKEIVKFIKIQEKRSGIYE